MPSHGMSQSFSGVLHKYIGRRRSKHTHSYTQTKGLPRVLGGVHGPPAHLLLLFFHMHVPCTPEPPSTTMACCLEKGQNGYPEMCSNEIVFYNLRSISIRSKKRRPVVLSTLARGVLNPLDSFESLTCKGRLRAYLSEEARSRCPKKTEHAKEHTPV